VRWRPWTQTVVNGLGGDFGDVWDIRERIIQRADSADSGIGGFIYFKRDATTTGKATFLVTAAITSTSLGYAIWCT
jgi:hypothetical protein